MIEPLLASVLLASNIFILARRHYASALLLGVFFVPVYLLRHRVGFVPTNAWEMSVLAITIAGATSASQRRLWRTALHRVPFWPAAAVAAFLLAASISTALSDQLIVSLGILKGWFLVPVLFAGLLAAQLLLQPDLCEQVVTALIASGLAIAVLALGMERHAGRLVGIYDVPNSLALYLSPLAAAVLWQSLSRPAYAVSAAIIYAAIIATQSLAGMAAPLLALAAGWVYIGAPPMTAARKAGAAVLLLTLVILTAAGARYKISYLRSQAPTSLDVRLQLWSIGWDLVQAHPLLGVGLGQFEPAYQQKLHERFQKYELQNNSNHESRITSRVPLPEFVFRDPHSWPLSMWLNTGVLGLGTFVVLNTWLLQHARRSAAVQRTAAVMLLAILTHGFVDTIYFKNDLAALYWLIAVVAGGPIALAPYQRRRERRRPNSPLTAP